MDETEHNARIEKISAMIINDNTSLDEHDQTKLKKYYDFVKLNYDLDYDTASERFCI